MGGDPDSNNVCNQGCLVVSEAPVDGQLSRVIDPVYLFADIQLLHVHSDPSKKSIVTSVVPSKLRL